MSDDRQTALSCVRHATEELREAVDVLLRLADAIQNAPEGAGVRCAAVELRAARPRLVAAVRDAQKRVDDIGSIGATRRGRPAVSTVRSRARIPMPAPPATSRHCEHGDCFQGLPEIDVCTCECAACTSAGEALLATQDEARRPLDR